MTAVDANAEDLRRLAHALEAYKKEVIGSASKVRGALRSAKWNDNRKTQFESRLNDVQKRLDSFMNGEVDQMVKSLRAYAHQLDEISKMRM